MSNTAVATVTLPNGAVVTSDMTPQERHNAHAKAIGAPVVEKPTQNLFPVTGMTDATAAEFARREGKAPPPSTVSRAPPSPKELEKQNAMPPQGTPSPARQAELDAELQRKGIQRRTDGRTLADGEVDTEALDALTSNYRRLVTHLQGKTDAVSVATAERFKTAYERDFKAILDGRQLTAKEIAKLKNSGDVETLVPVAKEKASKLSQPVSGQHARELTAAGKALERDVLAEFKALPAEEQRNPETIDAYNIGLVNIRANEHGAVALEHFNASMLHGYTLPRFIPDQHYPPGIIRQLAAARAAGVTQAQVDAYIRADMIKNGWIKA